MCNIKNCYELIQGDPLIIPGFMLDFGDVIYWFFADLLTVSSHFDPKIQICRCSLHKTPRDPYPRESPRSQVRISKNCKTCSDFDEILYVDVFWPKNQNFNMLLTPDHQGPLLQGSPGSRSQISKMLLMNCSLILTCLPPVNAVLVFKGHSHRSAHCNDSFEFWGLLYFGFH